jgi:hypothetical protein
MFGTPTSGSQDFDRLRDGIASDPTLRGQLEASMAMLVERVDVSDPGSRWVVGSTVEWMLASAAFHLGLVTLPAGHATVGTDLELLRNKLREKFSVKASFSNTSTYRISNGMTGAGRGFVDPTIFLHPSFGIAFADPRLHVGLAATAKSEKDAVTLSIRQVRLHAESHPECVITLTVPWNEHRGTYDPGTAFARELLDVPAYPGLRRIFKEVGAKYAAGTTVADEVRKLSELRDGGDLTEAQYQAAIERLLQDGR